MIAHESAYHPRSAEWAQLADWATEKLFLALRHSVPATTSSLNQVVEVQTFPKLDPDRVWDYKKCPAAGCADGILMVSDHYAYCSACDAVLPVAAIQHLPSVEPP